jgi:predicted amidohydrolase
VRVALAQTDCVLGDTEANLRRAKEAVKEARLALLARELNRLAEEGGDL